MVVDIAFVVLLVAGIKLVVIVATLLHHWQQSYCWCSQLPGTACPIVIIVLTNCHAGFLELEGSG